ncbi:MAG: hypothetical protein EBR82_50130, partial [Caulobacteraceae bacterium]|nr:hypothetical protein [Caulobacteraceae bacterium]
NVVNAEVDRIKPDVVFIDYLQIMTPQNSVQAGDTNKFFEDLTRDLKITSKRLNIPIVLLSQLNRSLETRTNKRPILSDIRKAAELIVAKNRNGMCGTAEMYFYDHLTKFTDLPIFPPKYKDDDQTPF